MFLHQFPHSKADLLNEFFHSNFLREDAVAALPVINAFINPLFANIELNTAVVRLLLSGVSYLVRHLL